jgi:NitT/TauT family transport system substrate-binding protein
VPATHLPIPARRPHRRRTAPAVLAAVPLAALLLTSCGYGSQAAGDAPATPSAAPGAKKLSAATVHIGYFPNLTHATALVGVQKGIFQKDLGGTKLSTATFNAGPSEIEALNAGSVDIGFIGPSPAVNGYAQSHGKTLKIISGAASGGVKFVVNPKKIKSVAEVKGKKIATPQLGNTQDVAFLNWLAGKGWKVDPQSGKGAVSVIREDNSVTQAAFRTGAIDGAWVPEPTASQLVAEGGRTLIDESSLWPGKKFVTTNVVVSQSFLKQHPDVVRAVLKGIVDTNQWINANPAAARTSANDALMNLSGKALPASVIDAAWPSIEFTDDPLAATLRAETDHGVKAGLLTKPSLAGIYDLAPLNAVLKSAGEPAVSAAGLGTQ